MAFYLLMHKHKECCFKIISKEELETSSSTDLFVIIASGDEANLKTTLKQLQGKAYIRGDIAMVSPLLKISRVVAVTSSGNTKYSISPTITDPYHTDSGEEYVPDMEKEISSSSEGSIVFSRGAAAKIRNVKRKITFHELFGPSISPAMNSQEHLTPDLDDERAQELHISPSTSTTTSIPPLCGEIRIIDKQVVIDILSTIHQGNFVVHLEENSTGRRNQCILKGNFLSQNKDNDHQCLSVDPRKSVGYLLLNADKNSVIVNIENCMQKGNVFGTLHFIKETNMFTSFLKFVDPYMDESEEEPLTEEQSRTVKMKQHYCQFCKQLRTCIGRHYKLQHHNEQKVKEIIEAAAVPETRIKAQTLMKRLRLEGDRIYNDSVPLSDRIPVRKHNIQMINYSVHCPSCSALIAARNFYRHHRRCTGRTADKKKRLRLLQGEERIQHSRSSEDEIFLSVVNNMTRDQLREIIESDPLAKSLAIYLVKSQPKTYNFNNVRQQLRRTAKLFLEVKKRTAANVQEMKDMFVPALYSTLMDSVRSICSFDEPQEKRKSQLALSYGPLISSLINRLQIQLLKSDVPGNDLQLQTLKNFQSIHEQEFKIEITREALTSSKHKKMSKTNTLPLTSDIQKLMEYTRKLGDKLFDRLKNNFDLEDWITLGKSLLCQLLVFNRRRVGEMSRVRVKDFQNRKQVTPDYFQSLNRLEIILAEEFSVFTIFAKRERPVNLLVTKSQITQLDLFISQRKQAGIPEHNEYLFASPTHSDGYLKAVDVLRTFASQCGASEPLLLKSTNLRKHVATMSQMFCLNDNEMKQLADFLGHERAVHEQFYRLNESNTQITKLSKFLCTVGDSNVFEHRGKTIDELPFDMADDEGPDTITDTYEDESGDEDVVEAAASSTIALSGSTVEKTSRPYTLRRKSALKPPAKLQSPSKSPVRERSVFKVAGKLQTPTKTPTTLQLLTMLSSPKPKPPKKSRWTPKEREVMEREFANNLQNKTLPSLSFIQEVKSRNVTELANREVHGIYCWLRNTINKK